MSDETHLAPFAMRTAASRGRHYAEPPHPFRTLYQRDRERIVHSSAFRRMTGKTQVLVASVNDHHRTRLTHTLEVAQIARTVARRLRLNEDLVEAIALAHDIGHPPFGHAGEQALHECLLEHGGFNHNLYGLRRVDWLEERYPDFPGLNLTFEVREAFIRHAGQLTLPDAEEFRSAGSALLEADVVDAVDSIAYDTHDVDDALSLNFISLADLEHLGLIAGALAVVKNRHGSISADLRHRAMIRELLAMQVNALLDETARRLDRHAINSLEAVRTSKAMLVGIGEPAASQKIELEQFLHKRVYRNSRVLEMTANGKRILRELFGEFLNSPKLVPGPALRRWTGAAALSGTSATPPLPHRKSEPSLPRIIGDYIAGMTDRFAFREHSRLFGASAAS